jgi:hypothetical protein
VAIDRPALETQYSPLLVEATVADIEVMLTMQPVQAEPVERCSIIQRAHAWVRK